MKGADLPSSPLRLITFSAVSLLLLLSYTGCGDDAGFQPEPQPGIALVPDSTAVKPGGHLRFTAVVTRISCDSLGWYVNDEPGGNEIYGTIASDGVYTAPIIPPDEPKVRVKAVCVADTTYFAEAVVLIVVSIPIELEDYKQVVNDTGEKITPVSCGAASGGRGVDGFDASGDEIVCEVVVERSGDYSGMLRAATAKGSHTLIRVTISGVGLAEDQVAEFDIVGRGVG